MCLKIQRSVNIFTISVTATVAAAAAVDDDDGGGAAGGGYEDVYAIAMCSYSFSSSFFVFSEVCVYVCVCIFPDKNFMIFGNFS